MSFDADQLYLNTMGAYENRYKNFYNDREAINQRWEQLLSQQAGFGESEKARLHREFAKQQGEMQQSMVNRGLGNTTVLDSAARGIGYDEELAGLSLNDQLLQRQNAIRQNQLNWQTQASAQLGAYGGEQLQYMGANQQNTQAQQVQAQLQAQQIQAQLQQTRLQTQAQTEAARIGVSNQAALSQQQYQQQIGLQNNQYGNQRNLQSEFGYYSHGGLVRPVRGYADGGAVYGQNRDPLANRGAMGSDGQMVYPPGMNPAFGAPREGPMPSGSQGGGGAGMMMGVPSDKIYPLNATPGTGQQPAAPAAQSTQAMGSMPLSAAAPSSAKIGMQPRYYSATTQAEGEGQATASMFGYAYGGPVGPSPTPGPTDTIPAMLTPGEFILSKDMVHALESGYLDKDRLLQMIRQGKAASAMPAPAPGYADGGFVMKAKRGVMSMHPCK